MSGNKYELSCSNGLEHFVWHFLPATGPEGPPEPVMWMMDAEFDPVRITYGGDGEINIHAEGNTYLAFNAEQLSFLAKMTREIDQRFSRWFDGKGDAEIVAAWGKYSE